MTATAPHDHHHHHELPTSGRALTLTAISATLHCLTGCAIGEVLGMAIGTALGLSNGATIVLAIVLAFFFGYSLTSLPLLRSGLALGAVIPIALASDTLSIATMEIVDNLIMVSIPGAMHAGLGDLLFWGSLSFALVIAGVVAVPVNRWLIARGKGHAVVHETGIHGGPSPRTVGIAAAIAFVFGSTVLAVEAFSSSDEGMGGHGGMAASSQSVRGLAVSDGELALRARPLELRRGEPAVLRFQVVGDDGRPVTDFEVEHERRMHVIVARRDLTGFQHLHPTMASDGTWSVPVTIDDAGSYRVFADFKHDGRNTTLATDLAVDGDADYRPLPAATSTADAGDGYTVRREATTAHAGDEAELRFTVLKNGRPVQVEPYLGAGGHLVALREGDLAFLHVHPAEDGATVFETEFPSAGRYRLFLQFSDGGKVRTAAFTQTVAG